MVSKKILQFEHQIINPAGYPRAGCLCHNDGSIDCMSEEISLVYPVQTVEMGFAIMDVKKVEQRFFKAWKILFLPNGIGYQYFEI